MLRKIFVTTLLAGMVPGWFFVSEAQAEITFLNSWGSVGSGDGQFNEPWGVAVGPSGQVYVAERNNHRIQRFSSDGTFETKWGSWGSGDGQFFYPRDVAVGATGQVYTVDKDSYRIQRFSSDGAFEIKWGTFGSGDGQFNRLRAVAVAPTGQVYAVDERNNRIQRFSSDGAFETKWGTLGSGDGQFNMPGGLAVAPTGQVYVADILNHRIQRFSSDGSFETKWGSSGSGDGQFNRPGAVAVAASGQVYVADSSNRRIQRFSSDGAFETKWGSSGSGDGQFISPLGVAVIPTGQVYVSDAWNDNVQRFLDSDAWVWGTNTFTNPATGPVDVGVGAGEMLGASFTLDAARGLVVGGTTVIAADGLFNLAGGTWTTGAVNNAGSFRVLLNPTVDFGAGGMTNTGELSLIATTVSGTVTSPVGSAINVIGTVTFNDLVSGAGGIYGSGTAVFDGGYDPGDSAAVVPVEGNVVCGAANTLFIELGGLLDGESDRVEVAGDVTLDGALSVELIDQFTLGKPEQFTIIETGGSLTGQFSGLEECGLVGTFGEDLFITYAGGDGNDVMLFTIPEPATLSLLALGACLPVFRRKRR